MTLRRITGAGKPRNVLKRAIVVVAATSVTIAALTACTTNTPKPKPTVLSTKAAAAYYLATTCRVDATSDLFTQAIAVAGQSKESTGPDLDNLKTAANDYMNASQDGALSLDDPKAPWPVSVKKSIVVVRDEYMSELRSLQDVGGALNMPMADAGAAEFNSTSKGVAAENLIRSKLGLPSTKSDKSCPPPPPLSDTPASGLLIKGTGYTFHAPTGWTLPDRPQSEDSYAISAKPNAKGYYDTINVIVSPSNKDDFFTEEVAGAQYLLQVEKATAVQVRPRVEFAGDEAVHISSVTNHLGVDKWNEQYLVTHDGADLYITFAFDISEPQKSREALAESVLASWSWT